jgi:uncharacterized protein YjcR
MRPRPEDKNRRAETEEARALKQADLERRRNVARRMYESGADKKDVAKQARCCEKTLRKWIREGGWKVEVT